MKTIRKEYPRVRQYVKRGHTYYAVDLRRKDYQGPKWKNFKDRATALDYASDIGGKVNQNGLSSISFVGQDPRVAGWSEQLAIYGKTIEEAISVALGVFEIQRKVKESPYMAELLTVWVDDKTTGLKKLRPKTLKCLRNMANVFQEDFGMSRIKEIDQERVESYLKGKDVSDQTRENLRNYLSQFFNWCIKKQHIEKNPADQIEIEVSRGTPGYFKADQCQSLMKEALKEEHKPITAYFALCLFGGIRPDEVSRMTWDKNINMDTKEIFLQHEITKTKKERIFKMSDVLLAWLEHCKGMKPLVPPTNIQNMRVRLLKGVNVPWIADGMRHTFSTFHYAKHKNFEELRHIMGNSPGIIERFYKGAVSHTEVDKFWNLTPKMVQEAE